MSRATLALDPPCKPEDDVCCGLPAGTACDDGDACTSADACAAGERCAGTLPDLAALRCELTRLRDSGLCAEPSARKAFRFVAAKVRRAGKLEAQGERRIAMQPAKARMLFQRAADALERLAVRTAAAVTHRKPSRRIPAACAATVATGIEHSVALLRQLPVAIP
jgi:hypothetical protein